MKNMNQLYILENNTKLSHLCDLFIHEATFMHNLGDDNNIYHLKHQAIEILKKIEQLCDQQIETIENIL